MIRLLSLLLLSLAGVAIAGTTIINRPISSQGSITSSANWELETTITPAPTGTATITVPGGNPGDLKFSTTATGCTQQYSKNGAAFGNYATDAVVNFSNGDTLAFRATGFGAGDSVLGTVYDNTTGAVVGTVNITYGP